MLGTIFLVAAVLGGTVMVCQLVMMFLGAGEDMSGDVAGDIELAGDAGGDFDPAGEADHPTDWAAAADADIGHPDASRLFEIFSFRSVIAAVTFFGFAGKASLASGHSETQALIVGLAAGAAALLGVYWLMQQIYQLRSAGNEDIRNAVGLPASVYVAIPGQRQGQGKVHVRMQNRTVEYQAITEQQDSLKSGEQAVVLEILNSDTVLVASADAPSEVA